MRKPQVEHLWNDITLTLASPEGAIMYHLISIMFFLMTRIEPARWCYFTQNTSVIVSHVWTVTAHRGVNFKFSCRNLYVQCLHIRIDPYKKKQKIHNTKCKIQNVKYTLWACQSEGSICHLPVWFMNLLPPFRLQWPQKRNSHLLVTVTGQQGDALVFLPVIPFLLFHDSVSHDCSWASSSPRGPMK